MIDIIGTVDIEKILEQYYSIQEQIQWTDMPPKYKQAGLQYAEHTDNLWVGGTGKLMGLANSEQQYTNLNPILQGTIFEDIINEYKLVRTRFMWLNSRSCYSMHRDMTPRIHIPLITNPACYFVLKPESGGIIEHLPAGKVYWIDTRTHHTFMNCSTESRLHLIGVPENS
jgi:hypothetical protein